MSEKEIVKIMVTMATLQEKMIALTDKIGDLEETLDTKYTLSSDFVPVKKIVYGASTIILTSALIAMIAVIIKR